MIDTSGLMKTVVGGLKKYLDCEVVRANQTARKPKYPYVGFNITTLSSENKGTLAKWEEQGKLVKPVTQTWSITARSRDYDESVRLANKAHDFLEYFGSQYLTDNNVIVESVGSVTDRSNLLTSEYEYAYGFDCFFTVNDEMALPDEGYIEEFNITMKED